MESVGVANPELRDPEARIRSTPLWLELSRITSFKLINESMATYRVLLESACHSRNWATVATHMRYNHALRLHYMHKYNVDSATRTRTRTSFAREFLAYAYIVKDRKLAEDAWVELKSCGASAGLKDLVHYIGTKNASIRVANETFRRLKRRLSRTQS